MKKVYTSDDILSMKEGDTIYLHSGMILTPAARDLAKSRGIKIEGVQNPSMSPSGGGGAGGGGGTGDGRAVNSSNDLETIKRLVGEKLGTTASSTEIENGVRNVLLRLQRDRKRIHLASELTSSPNLTNPSSNISTIKADNAVVSPTLTTSSLETTRSGNERIIVSVVGLDQPGIVAGITTVINELGANIADISQRIMEDFFVMIIVVDLNSKQKDFDIYSEKLQKKGDELGVKVWVQHEDVFRYVHRV